MSLAKKGMAIYSNFRFTVEIDDIYVARFESVQGLEVELETTDLLEGGMHDFVHKLPGRMRFQPVVFSRGICESMELWVWLNEVGKGKVTRRTVTINLLDEKSQIAYGFVLHEAYPTKWTGPKLGAMDNSVAIETIEMVHHGLSIEVPNQTKGRLDLLAEKSSQAVNRMVTAQQLLDYYMSEALGSVNTAVKSVTNVMKAGTNTVKAVSAAPLKAAHELGKTASGAVSATKGSVNNLKTSVDNVAKLPGAVANEAKKVADT